MTLKDLRYAFANTPIILTNGCGGKVTMTNTLYGINSLVTLEVTSCHIFEDMLYVHVDMPTEVIDAYNTYSSYEEA